MATFNLESSFKALPDIPVFPCYEGHPVVQSKILDFSAFKPLGPREVYEALSSFITTRDMLVIVHSDTAQPVSMHQLTLEALTLAMRTRLRSEAQALLGDEHMNVFEDLKTIVHSGDESAAQAMNKTKKASGKSATKKEIKEKWHQDSESSRETKENNLRCRRR